MKKDLFYTLLCVFLLAAMAGCKKSSYLTDGGLSDPKSPLSTYDYLKSHKYRLFDTLITVVDHYNLKNEMNAAPTVFAPTNYSINNYMRIKRAQKQLINENALYTLDSLYKDITADSVRIYFIKSRIELTSTPLQATRVENAAGTSSAVQRIQQAKVASDWSSEPIYSLYYTRVRGAIDADNASTTGADADTKVKCQTTGIEPSSGGMLHVLNNQHVFVRF